MKNLLKFLTPFAPDQSGASAALYELGGLIVICDAGGCAGNVCGFDEPRWFTRKSAIFSAGLRDMDAILGRDDKLVEKLSKAAQQIKPAFTAIIGTPVPAVIATDFRALRKMTEKATGLPCITCECTGTNYYDAGEEQAFLDIFKAFAEKSLPVQKGRLGIIGATPLEISSISADKFITACKKQGWKDPVCYGMGTGLDEIKAASSAEKNLVISPAGIKAAEYLKEKFSTPYEIDFPCIPESVINSAQNLNGKKVLIIHTQTAANSLREKLTPEYGCECTAATFFMQKSTLCRKGDFKLNGEEDLQNITSEDYDVVIGDKVLRRAMKNFKGEFIDFPHFALSGNLTD